MVLCSKTQHFMFVWKDQTHNSLATKHLLYFSACSHFFYISMWVSLNNVYYDIQWITAGACVCFPGKEMPAAGCALNAKTAGWQRQCDALGKSADFRSSWPLCGLIFFFTTFSFEEIQWRVWIYCWPHSVQIQTRACPISWMRSNLSCSLPCCVLVDVIGTHKEQNPSLQKYFIKAGLQKQFHSKMSVGIRI